MISINIKLHILILKKVKKHEERSSAPQLPVSADQPIPWVDCKDEGNVRIILLPLN